MPYETGDTFPMDSDVFTPPPLTLPDLPEINIATAPSDTSWSNVFQQIGFTPQTGQSIAQALLAYAQYKNLDATQKAFLQVNATRAQQGLGPVSWDAFGQSTAARVGLSLDNRTLLLIGGGIVAAIVLARVMR